MHIEETLLKIITITEKNHPEWSKISYFRNILRGNIFAQMYHEGLFAEKDGMFGTFPDITDKEINDALQKLLNDKKINLENGIYHIEEPPTLKLKKVNEKINHTLETINTLETELTYQNIQLKELQQEKAALITLLTKQWLISAAHCENINKYTETEFTEIPGIDNFSFISGCVAKGANVYSLLGKTFVCDSVNEVYFLRRLDKEKLAVNISGQSPVIGYLSMAKNLKSYRPDFIFLSKNGEVVMVEIKNWREMSNHINIEKYYGLKDFCEENGFRYIMTDCDKKGQLTTFDDILKTKIPAKIQKKFDDWKTKKISKKYKLLDEETILSWFNASKLDELNQTDYMAIEKLIIDNWCFNNGKHGFQVYSRGIIQNNEHIVTTVSEKDYTKWF